jgi:hypothetical protein
MGKEQELCDDSPVEASEGVRPLPPVKHPVAKDDDTRTQPGSGPEDNAATREDFEPPLQHFG